jgi:alkylated DNA nucleotide flippase Atl1
MAGPPPELDDPRPDEAEHLQPAGSPGSPGSPANGLLGRIAAVVAEIPPGRVATYGQVAAQAGNRRAARQVAWALRAHAGNGLPWHRVIGAGGAIRLPGDGLTRQRSLLLAEGVAVDPDGRLDLTAYQWRP